jgi:ubiquinone/menaquinone biosynthesis C-methylase UbiE
MTAAEGSYAFENVREVQRERLGTLEALLDAGTIRQLETSGVGPGWRCLEVGAGGGSIAAWLCERVAPGGSVVATDLDTTVLAELSHPNLEIKVHDVLSDELPHGAFDLVHLRLVLAWLAKPQVALRRLIAALKPGGWLVAEEMDFVSAVPDQRLDAASRDLFARAVQAHNAVLAERHSFEPFYGRRLVGELEDAGFTDVGCEGRASMWRGAQPGGAVWRLTLAQLREPMIEAGLMTPADVDAVIALCDDPRLSVLSPIIMAGRGRRPAGE